MTDDPKPMTHTMKLRIVTKGAPAYNHKTWAEVIESILLNEINGVLEAEVLEDWV